MVYGVAMMDIAYVWRGQIDNATLNELHAEAFEHELFADDWATLLQRHSLGWVTAHDRSALVGFLNVVWDGAVHAWLQDVIVATCARRDGVGTELVKLATVHATKAGCEWLHVDFDSEHRAFYIEACGFAAAAAGLLRL